MYFGKSAMRRAFYLGPFLSGPNSEWPCVFLSASCPWGRIFRTIPPSEQNGLGINFAALRSGWAVEVPKYYRLRAIKRTLYLYNMVESPPRPILKWDRRFPTPLSRLSRPVKPEVVR